MNIKEETKQMKLASPLLASAPMAKRNAALKNIRNALNVHKEEIFEANRMIWPWPTQTEWLRQCKNG